MSDIWGKSSFAYKVRLNNFLTEKFLDFSLVDIDMRVNKILVLFVYANFIYTDYEAISGCKCVRKSSSNKIFKI